MSYDATKPAGADKIKDSDDNIRANFAAIGAVLPTLNTGGGQVVFPATQDPSADVNTLDDYEEGTWTPVIAGTGGDVTMTVQIGRYVKIGKQVTLWGTIKCSAWTLTGALSITGLPFTADATANYFNTGSMFTDNVTITAVQIISFVNPGGVILYPILLNSAATSTQLDGAAGAATSAFYFCITYHV